jgi:hypothetical protein
VRTETLNSCNKKLKSILMIRITANGDTQLYIYVYIIQGGTRGYQKSPRMNIIYMLMWCRDTYCINYPRLNSYLSLRTETLNCRNKKLKSILMIRITANGDTQLHIYIIQGGTREYHKSPRMNIISPSVVHVYFIWPSHK